MKSTTFFQFAFNFWCFFITGTILTISGKNDPQWMRSGFAALAFTGLVMGIHATVHGFRRKKAERFELIRQLSGRGDYHYEVKYEYTKRDQ